MAYRDTERGEKGPDAPQFPLLQYLHRLSTRKLVILVAAAVLIPGWLTLSYIQGLSYVTDDVDDVQMGGGKKPTESMGMPTDFSLDEKVKPTGTQSIEVVETSSEAEDDDTPASETEGDKAVETSEVEDLGDGGNEDDEEKQQKQEEGQSEDEDDDEVDDDSEPPKKESDKSHSDENKKPEDQHKSEDQDESEDDDDDSDFMPPPPENPPTPPPVEQTELAGVADVPTPPEGLHRMVIIVPLDSPNPNLCKTMFSGMANGYPAPVIVNWGNVGDRPYGGRDRSHLMKITKSLEYLDTMMSEKAHEDDRIDPNDLIVLTDALDVWWQLPPEVFLKRYHEANREADKRLAKEWGLNGHMTTRQKIIGAAQKRCWPTPEMGINLHCDALPKNPLRADLYGNRTDTGDEPRNWRVRSINSGTIVGPAADFRRYLRRAQDRMSRIHSVRPTLVSDQGLLGEVFGEQEVYRNWLRNLPNKADKKFMQDPATEMIKENYEYYFGLDYTQKLVISTVFEEDDGEIFHLNNQSYINEMSSKLGIDPVRLKGVPEDIRSVETPLKKYLPEKETPEWGDLPLYADFYTEAVPVLLHNNAHINGLKGRRQWWWDRTWYFPYLRPLVKKYLEVPLDLPELGSYTIDNKTTTYKALPSELKKRLPRRFSVEMAEKGLPVMQFEDVCKGKVGDTKWFDEVFRDGLGPL